MAMDNSKDLNMKGKVFDLSSMYSRMNEDQVRSNAGWMDQGSMVSDNKQNDYFMSGGKNQPDIIKASSNPNPGKEADYS